jgi:SAM-dependent methyltransferase
MFIAPVVAGRVVGMVASARYDGHAQWYDTWAQTSGAPFMDVTRRVLRDLLPAGNGVALDIGCGTGLHAAVLRERGYVPIGIDYSIDQLRHAVPRLPVVRADARHLPVRTASMAAAVSLATHTDVDDFAALAAEAVRTLRPTGSFVYVGVHPCFVHPFVEPEPTTLRMHEGYRRPGWHDPTPFTGTSVRARVGVHHLPLAELLNALAETAHIERVREDGPGAYPQVLGLRLSATSCR